MSLEKDLEERSAKCKTYSNLNYTAAYLFLIIAVAASASATISVAASAFTKEVNAILAALPGISLLIANTFKFEARAEWWLEKHNRLDNLYRGLKYEGREEVEISKELTNYLEELNKKWPSFGKFPL